MGILGYGSVRLLEMEISRSLGEGRIYLQLGMNLNVWDNEEVLKAVLEVGWLVKVSADAWYFPWSRREPSGFLKREGVTPRHLGLSVNNHGKQLQNHCLLPFSNRLMSPTLHSRNLLADRGSTLLRSVRVS